VIWCHCSKQNKKYWFFKILKTWNILKVNPMPGTTLAFANYIKKNWFYSFFMIFSFRFEPQTDQKQKTKLFSWRRCSPGSNGFGFRKSRFFISAFNSGTQTLMILRKIKMLSRRNCSTKFLQEFKFRVFLIEFRLHLCYQGS